MPPSAPTLYDVAREAGVSLATASRVVNGSERKVAEGYRERVLEAAARIGYTANLSAQAMARGTSRVAALLVSDIADPFFSSIAGGVSRAAEREGLVVTMSVTDRDPRRELDLLRELRGLRPRLVVLVGSRFSEEPHRHELEAELSGFESDGGRVVLIGQHALPFATVRIDDAAGAASLAHRLVESGRRDFAVLAGPVGLTTAVERTEGFLGALDEHGLSVDDTRIVHGAFTRDGGHEAATELLANGLSQSGRLDAIFAVSDAMAIGALTALRDADIAVPTRIAVAGFDDIPAARDAFPALSTVRVALGELGERAVALALSGVGGVVVLPTEPVLRASTGH